MSLTQPSELDHAIAKIGGRTQVGSIIGSSDWQDVPVALRDRAFFSAHVESARFLSAAQSFLMDFLKGTTETLPNGEVALKADGRARFIAQMQKLAIEEGLGPIGKIQDKSVRDIRSNARLGLIFDTQTRSAYQYGSWRSGLTDSILDAFPAQKFVRYPGAKIKRPLHEENEGAIRLKSDLQFWLSMNAKDIGGFEVPWGPWGFNSWMDVKDVSRKQAEELGLIEHDEKPASIQVHDFNRQLTASVSGLSIELQQKLKDAFGAQVRIANQKATWKSQSPPVKPKVKPAKPEVPSPVPVIAPPAPPPSPKVKPEFKPAEQIRKKAGITQALIDNFRCLFEQEKITEKARLAYTNTGYGQGALEKEILEREQAKQREIAKSFAGQAHDARLAIEKALVIPRARRGTINIAKGSEYTHPKYKKINPSPKRWEWPINMAKRAAGWFKDKLPEQFNQPVTVGYANGREFALPAWFEVYLNDQTGSEVAVHEIAHVLEVKNKGWLQKAIAFRASRTKNEPLLRLKDLTGLNYEDSELTLRDKWLENGGKDYAGKVYPDQDATEIITMGIQRLYEEPARFAALDPEYFDFIVNLIRGVE